MNVLGVLAEREDNEGEISSTVIEVKKALSPPAPIRNEIGNRLPLL
jgi:hypothetical protein